MAPTGTAVLVCGNWFLGLWREVHPGPMGKTPAAAARSQLYLILNLGRKKSMSVFSDQRGGAYAGVRLVQSGVTFQESGGPGPIAVQSPNNFITAGVWHRATFTHVIGGPNTSTSVEIFNYSTSLSVTYNPVTAMTGTGLDLLALHSTDGGTTQFDNISVSGVAVPEPTSAILLSLGLVTMLGCGRRNRR